MGERYRRGNFVLPNKTQWMQIVTRRAKGCKILEQIMEEQGI